MENQAPKLPPISTPTPTNPHLLQAMHAINASIAAFSLGTGLGTPASTTGLAGLAASNTSEHAAMQQTLTKLTADMVKFKDDVAVIKARVDQ